MLAIFQTFFPTLMVLTITETPPAPPAPVAPAVATKAAGKPTPKPAKPIDPAEALATKVQRFYDSTKDFSADFIQLYTRVALSRTSESRGAVKVLKPGMMRWDYTQPEAKHFIADGKQLFVYDPEEQHVSIDPKFQIGEQGTSLSFLWGQGKLSDSFGVKLGDRVALNAPAGAEVLILTPKKDATYVSLALIVDVATGRVDESIIHETTGNTNRFKFSNVRTNGGLTAAAFQFTPPPGVEIAIINR